MGRDVQDLLARDFSDAGKCNFYTTRDTFLQSPIVLLIQVNIMLSHKLLANSHPFYPLQKESAYSKDINRLIVASQEMGLMSSLFHNNVKNSTECQTWQQLEESHKALGKDVSFRVANHNG